MTDAERDNKLKAAEVLMLQERISDKWKLELARTSEVYEKALKK